MQPQVFSPQDHMIVSQLMTGTVMDPAILNAMASVERARFVPPAFRASACLDGEVPLGEGRYMLEPLTFARMLALAAIAPGDTVLDVACATGYSTAVIARLAGRAVGIESNENLVWQAVENLAAANEANATFILQRLTEGYRPFAPYDAILVEGDTGVIPQPWRDQLKEHGRLVVIEGARGTYEGRRLGRLVVYRKQEGRLYRQECYDAAAMPIPELRAPERFTF
jgi:protein-L-isoaspartate(D-aspartate) O-methyltransferase